MYVIKYSIFYHSMTLIDKIIKKLWILYILSFYGPHKCLKLWILYIIECYGDFLENHEYHRYSISYHSMELTSKSWFYIILFYVIKGTTGTLYFYGDHFKKIIVILYLIILWRLLVKKGKSWIIYKLALYGKYLKIN